jgi:prepilin-type N-terminal cleavage/methylation domain-containing protein
MKVSKILATRMARRYHQQGLTLIELLVVLVILIALAGILIPQLPNMLTRAHTAAASTNIPEANKRIQEFEQIYFQQPAGYDNLVNGVALVAYLPGDETTYLNPAALSTVADSADALNAAGITAVAPLVAAAGLGGAVTPTFNPYSGANVAVTDATVVAFVPEADAELLLRPDAGANDSYVAFGIGQRSELIGRTTNEAPYHFGDAAGTGPDTNYARYLAVYKVANDGTALNKAIFIGVLAAHDDGLANASGHVSEFFETNSEL